MKSSKSSKRLPVEVCWCWVDVDCLTLALEGAKSPNESCVVCAVSEGDERKSAKSSSSLIVVVKGGGRRLGCSKGRLGVGAREVGGGGKGKMLLDSAPELVVVRLLNGGGGDNTKPEVGFGRSGGVDDVFDEDVAIMATKGRFVGAGLLIGIIG